MRTDIFATLRLAQLVPEAELAMFKRELELYNCPRHSEELSTMPIASEALRVVKRRIIKSVVLGPSKGDDARVRQIEGERSV